MTTAKNALKLNVTRKRTYLPKNTHFIVVVAALSSVGLPNYADIVQQLKLVYRSSAHHSQVVFGMCNNHSIEFNKWQNNNNNNKNQGCCRCDMRLRNAAKAMITKEAIKLCAIFIRAICIRLCQMLRATFCVDMQKIGSSFLPVIPYLNVYCRR